MEAVVTGGLKETRREIACPRDWKPLNRFRSLSVTPWLAGGHWNLMKRFQRVLALSPYDFWD